jgi:hypothetical protein
MIASLLRMGRTSPVARNLVSGLLGIFLLLTAASPSALAYSGTVPTAALDGTTVLNHHHHHHHHHHGDGDHDRDDNDNDN